MELVAESDKKAFLKQAESAIEAKHEKGEHTHHLSEAVNRIGVLGEKGPINAGTIATAIAATKAESYPNLEKPGKEKYSEAQELLNSILDKVSKQTPSPSAENISVSHKEAAIAR